MKKKIVKFLIKLLISLGFLAWIIFKVDWHEVFENLTKILWWQIALYAGVILVGIGISAYKWQKLALAKNINLPVKDFYKFYLTGTLVNNFMPSFIGGDTYRVYETGKNEGTYIEATSVVMMDRITGFVALLILTLIFSVLNLKTILDHPILIAVNILVLASFSSDILLVQLQKLPLWSWLKKYIPKIILRIGHEVKNYSNADHILTKAVILGIIFNALGVGVANYIIFRSLGIEIGILNFCSVIFLISIISALPVSINNIGIKEWAYISFFGFFGISASLAVTAAILGRLMQMIISFFAIPYYLKEKGGNLSFLKGSHIKDLTE